LGARPSGGFSRSSFHGFTAALKNASIFSTGVSGWILGAVWEAGQVACD